MLSPRTTVKGLTSHLEERMLPVSDWNLSNVAPFAQHIVRIHMASEGQRNILLQGVGSQIRQAYAQAMANAIATDIFACNRAVVCIAVKGSAMHGWELLRRVRHLTIQEHKFVIVIVSDAHEIEPFCANADSWHHDQVGLTLPRRSNLANAMQRESTCYSIASTEYYALNPRYLCSLLKQVLH